MAGDPPQGASRGDRRVALALGAGGTRGWAHVGVIKVLHGAGVPIDLVVGASAGALIGPLYAAARDVASMERWATGVTPSELLDWLLRGLRIAPDAGPLGRRLWQAYGRLTFAEMALPFAVAALDLESGERLLLREGRVGPAVEVGIRPPLLFRPAVVDGRHLVDGGLQKTLPVEAAYELGATVVIGVQIGPRIQLPPALRPLSALVGEAFHRRGPDADSVEGQVGFLARLLAGGHQAGRPPDILIKPNLAGISAMSPFQLRQAVRRGEAAARAALPRIRSLLAERPAQAGRPP